MTVFYRFPSTPHLTWLGEKEPRNDKVMSSVEANILLSAEVVVEEKIDGANLGISINKVGQIRVQNRGQYIPQLYSGQFTRLTAWLGQHGATLRNALTPNLILFGEWCAAKHSLNYDALPDWFLLFDVYDRQENKFWSISRRNQLAKKLGITTVVSITTGHFSCQQLIQLLDNTLSRYREGVMEGVIIRRDSNAWNESRAKLVKREFTQAIDEHWRSRSIEWNRVDYTLESSKQ